MREEEDRDVITLTKAVGIILVVLAHAMPTEHIVWKVIYTFHMPLFFIMSGYCFKEKYLGDAKQFISRKIIGIYVPFVLFSLPFLYMHNVLCDLFIYNPMDIYGWKKFLWDTGRIITRMSHNEQLLCTFWFLKELFWGNMIFYGMLRLWKGKVIPTAITLLALSELAALTGFRVPYFSVTCVSFLSSFFISVGYCWSQKNWRIDKVWIWIVMILLFSANVVISELMPYSADMLNLKSTTILIYVLPACAGTMMAFEICGWLQPYLKGWVRNFSLYIGKQSLFIMALHFLAFKMVQLGMIGYYGLPIDKLSDFPVMYDHVTIYSVVLCTIVGVFTPLVVAWGWNYIKCKVYSVRCKV